MLASRSRIWIIHIVRVMWPALVGPVCMGRRIGGSRVVICVCLRLALVVGAAYIFYGLL